MTNEINEYITTVRGLINMANIYIPFTFENVRRLEINNKTMYLWQNAKGDVHYCFSLFEKNYYTTNAIKLGNVLSEYFSDSFSKYEIEVVNNEKEKLKKLKNAGVGLSKALVDAEKNSFFSNNSQKYELPSVSNNNNIYESTEEILQQLDHNPSQNTSALQQYQSPPNQQDNLKIIDNLDKGIVQLSTYYLESHLDTIFIKISELPIVYEEKYVPNTKLAFFNDDNGLNKKNKFIPSILMVSHFNLCDPNQSFVILFIFFMANKDIHQTLKVLAWLSDSFTSLNKLPFALVLYSKNKDYLKLFYEEIVEPYFHDFQCEKIESDGLDAKTLSQSLDEKIIYNFHNITAQTILDEPAYELTNRLIHKDKYKLNRKSITTVANVLITSTSKYIPMIADDVPFSIVNVDSSIDNLCKYINIKPNKHTLANYFKNDMPNFIGILRSIDIDKLVNEHPVIDDNNSDLLDGDIDATEIFDNIIREKDIIPFRLNATTKKEQNLVNKMIDDFKQNRVEKTHLLDYFEIIFGKGIYKSNTALIAALRKDYSNTNEPFDDYKTHVRNGRGYYFF